MHGILVDSSGKGLNFIEIRINFQQNKMLENRPNNSIRK